MVLAWLTRLQGTASVINNSSNVSGLHDHTYAMPAPAAKKYEATKTRLLGGCKAKGMMKLYDNIISKLCPALVQLSITEMLKLV